jgi:glycosyltransferase involved in cell wall biosynthesis
MIVRDEEDLIERTLLAAKPLVDTWTIIDTGSVDSTPDIIRETLGDVEGSLLHRPWVNFGHNRSELFQYAKGTADHLMLLDADMVVSHDGPLPDLTAADVWNGTIEHSVLDYDLPILVNGHRDDWRYEGVCHSFLAANSPFTQNRLPGLRVKHEGKTTVEKLERDLELLSEEHRHNPLHARTAFYLAQTYRDLGMIPEAISMYRVRANQQGWAEETFYARYRLGCLLCEHVSFEQGSAELLAAWRMRPTRIEPLRALARSANNVADKAAYPADRLFVHRDAYK